jgi:hypothetical protein
MELGSEPYGDRFPPMARKPKLFGLSSRVEEANGERSRPIQTILEEVAEAARFDDNGLGRGLSVYYMLAAFYELRKTRFNEP